MTSPFPSKPIPFECRTAHGPRSRDALPVGVPALAHEPVHPAEGAQSEADPPGQRHSEPCTEHGESGDVVAPTVSQTLGDVHRPVVELPHDGQARDRGKLSLVE